MAQRLRALRVMGQMFSSHFISSYTAGPQSIPLKDSKLHETTTINRGARGAGHSFIVSIMVHVY